MIESTHLDELEAPLASFHVLFVPCMRVADDSQGVEELIDRSRVKYLFPTCSVVLHGRHSSQVFDLLLELHIDGEFLKEIPCLFNEARRRITAKETEKLVVILLLLRYEELRMRI